MEGLHTLIELAARMDRLGVIVTRVGLVVPVWIGGLKAHRYEDEGIVHLVANSPSMGFLYREPPGEHRNHVNPDGARCPSIAIRLGEILPSGKRRCLAPGRPAERRARRSVNVDAPPVQIHHSTRGRAMDIRKENTALVVIDPQNDVLSEAGVSWPLVGESVRENDTVANIERLFRAAKSGGLGVFISPHYLYPSDQAWRFGGLAEKSMLDGKEFYRPGPLTLDGLSGSGADWLDRYRPFIEDGETVVVSPHKVWGPQTNDLVLQLRKRNLGKVVLAGMLANLCVESHLRELLEQGFEVAVVRDATAGPRHPDLGDGYAAALVNYHFIANAVLSTREAVTAMK
jgi:nicotinamidase-related amidase